MAASVAKWLSGFKNTKLIDDLLKAGVVVTDDMSPRGGKLEGTTWVLTGTLPTLGRDEASAMIEAQGGKTSSSVSAKTSYLLAGEETGSKLAKAQKLGVKVIDEAEFHKILGA